eukprot:6235453-Karenia_brevis.AAC.1
MPECIGNVVGNATSGSHYASIAQLQHLENLQNAGFRDIKPSLWCRQKQYATLTLPLHMCTIASPNIIYWSFMVWQAWGDDLS